MLVDLVLKFPEGHLSLVCGKLGIGKTLSLLAILGEADILTSQAISHLSPCLDNTLLGLPFNEERYQKTDLKILEDGDQSESGECSVHKKLDHTYFKCIKGELVHERTAILVSRRVQLCLTGASYVVALDDGLVTALPSPIIARQDGPTSSLASHFEIAVMRPRLISTAFTTTLRVSF
ncbi:uncharacterized protein HD556DRAFT_1445536 [Suillus plorans]|uniref:Uncharacterized protein n=1 Tax=Suillus plorans TaxID=116603 RepID=A0A9P7AJY7_9AGAM|nr:uncharacterized protein HD556DRAFT_1445536 [Suillus plorans]KAG1791013.1 hypothetical protein HD556DRAFT_1445536 [Suillus plorans]